MSEQRRADDGRLSTIMLQVDDLTTAMFAEDGNNKFHSAGVMTTMQRLNTHIDAVCVWAKWVKRSLFFFATCILPFLVAAYQMGYIHVGQ